MKTFNEFCLTEEVNFKKGDKVIPLMKLKRKGSVWSRLMKVGTPYIVSDFDTMDGEKLLVLKKNLDDADDEYQLVYPDEVKKA